MSDFNFNISDKEIRDLLKLRLLEENEDNSLTQTLITMETNLAFAQEPLFAPSLQKENELLQQLSGAASKASILLNKWLLLMLGTIGLLSVILVAKQNPPSPKQSKAITAPVLIEAEEDFKEPFYNLESETANLEEEMVKETLFPVSAILDSVQSPKEININPTLPHQKIEPIKIAKHPFVPTYNTFSTSNIPAQIDTLFNGIREIAIVSGICNVKVTGSERKDLRLKGAIVERQNKKNRKKTKYEIKYSVKEDVLLIWVESEKSNRSMVIKGDEMKSFIELQVPKRTDLVVKSFTGNIDVAGLNGNICNLDCKIGNISATDIGTNIHVESSSGDINLERINGDVVAKSSIGNQSFKNIKGDLKTKNSSGDIDINNLTGSAHVTSSIGSTRLNNCSKDIYIKSSSGEVKAKDIKGVKCEIITSIGDISVKNASSKLKLTSSSGSINVFNNKGEVSVTTSIGNLDLESITGNVAAKTSSGDISLNKITGNIDSKTSLGSIELLTTKGSLSAKTSSGSIDGSQIELLSNSEFSTTYGDIEIQLVNSPEELSFDLKTTLGALEIRKTGLNQKTENKEIKIENGKIKITGITQSGNQLYE